MSVIVTGPHGGSRAGLAVLLEEIQADRASTSVQQWIRAHQQPIPRFDAIAQLRQLIPTTTPYPPIAGMDSSDGLANALLQLSYNSDIGMDILIPNIPLPPALSDTVGPDTALQWALYGGEDFELVLCLPSDLAHAFIQTGHATHIGNTNNNKAVRLLSSPDDKIGTTLTYKGFQHF